MCFFQNLIRRSSSNLTLPWVRLRGCCFSCRCDLSESSCSCLSAASSLTQVEAQTSGWTWGLLLCLERCWLCCCSFPRNSECVSQPKNLSWGMMPVSGVLATGVRTWTLLPSAMYVRQRSASSFLFLTAPSELFMVSAALWTELIPVQKNPEY